MVPEAIGWLKIMTLVLKKMKQEEGDGEEMNGGRLPSCKSEVLPINIIGQACSQVRRS